MHVPHEIIVGCFRNSNQELSIQLAFVKEKKKKKFNANYLSVFYLLTQHFFLFFYFTDEIRKCDKKKKLQSDRVNSQSQKKNLNYS